MPIEALSGVVLLGGGLAGSLLTGKLNRILVSVSTPDGKINLFDHSKNAFQTDAR